MRPRIGAITIGVDDLKASLKFYRDGLGFATQGIVGSEFPHGEAVFFDLQNGLKLALYRRVDLAHDAGIAPTSRSPTEFSLGHNVRSRREVDEVIERAVKAGARLVKPAQKTFWGGYAGYFQDPDDHLWEILFNPDYLPSD